LVSPEGRGVIRLAQPAIGDDEIAAVSAVLQSGWLVQGVAVHAFESEVARLAGTEHAVAVTNGTAALHLSLMALGIGRNDRVAVATYSWPATANVIALVGATPVFIDIEPQTMGMDPGRLAEALKRDPGIRAILPVHVFGGFCDLPNILEHADRHDVPVIEDAACALGARLRCRPAGGWGRMGCFSFHPRKIVTTGEGGAVVTNDAALADALRALRNHGLDPTSAEPDFIRPGLNCRMTEFQAALGSSQLARHGNLVAAHRRIADWYAEALWALPLTLPEALEAESHVYQAYVIRLSPALAPKRREIIERLRAAGVEATIGTHHLPLTSYFRSLGGFDSGDFPVTDVVAASALALPMHHGQTRDDVDTVTRSLAAAFERMPQ
jgi:dTDP-4-amino-4,6-dideoxygalactose transaminase